MGIQSSFHEYISFHVLATLCFHPSLQIRNVRGSVEPDHENITSYGIQYAHLHCPDCGLNCYGQRGSYYHLFFGQQYENWKLWIPKSVYEQELR